MDISAAIRIWQNVLLRPGEESFVEAGQSPQANLSTALLWIVLAAVISAIFGFMRSLIFSTATAGYSAFINQMDLPADAQSQIETLLAGPIMGIVSGTAGGIATLISMPVFFLVGVGISYLIGAFLQGKGDFGRFAYLNAAFSAPIAIITAVVTFIPVVGACVSGLLSLYSLVLNVFAVKVGLNLSTGKAIAVVLIPIAVVIALVGCFIFAILGIFVAGNG